MFKEKFSMKHLGSIVPSYSKLAITDTINELTLEMFQIIKYKRYKTSQRETKLCIIF